MKIMQVGKFYPPFRGGMETVLKNLVEGLLDEGLAVRTLVSAESRAGREDVIIGPQTGRQGKLIRAGRLTTVFSQPINPDLPRILERQIKEFQPDLVHLHLPNPLTLGAWESVRQFMRAPMPGLVVWHHADITRQKLAERLIRPWKRKIYQRSLGICASSSSLVEGSRHLSGMVEKVRVIPFGIDPHPWSQIQAEMTGDFLFVGRLVGYKGLSVLMEAMTLTDARVTLSIVGEGPLEGWLQDQMADSRLAGRVRYLGSCSEADMAQQMTRARGLILPSRDSSETFGLVQLEAMAAGLPVVASNLPTGVREVGIPGETCRLVPPGDAPALAQTLDTMLHNPELGRAMGHSGRRRFLENFTRKTMCQNVARWYSELIHEVPS